MERTKPTSESERKKKNKLDLPCVARGEINIIIYIIEYESFLYVYKQSRVRFILALAVFVTLLYEYNI